MDWQSLITPPPSITLVTPALCLGPASSLDSSTGLWSAQRGMGAGVRALTTELGSRPVFLPFASLNSLSLWLLLINVTQTNNGKAQLRLTSGVLCTVRGRAQVMMPGNPNPQLMRSGGDTFYS